MELLKQLDYSDTDSFLQDKIKTLLDHPDEKLLAKLTTVLYRYHSNEMSLTQTSEALTVIA